MYCKLDTVETFFSMLSGNLVRREDNYKMVWKDDKKGLFFVKSFYEVLDLGRTVIVPKKIIWNSWVPSKVSFFFFAWEASWGRVITFNNL